MAAAGEMTASLTLRLRDELTAGIQELRDQFRELTGTMRGLTDVLGEVRASLDTLKAPEAMVDGLRAATGQADAVSASVRGIARAADVSGVSIKEAIVAPLGGAVREIKAADAALRDAMTLPATGAVRGVHRQAELATGGELRSPALVGDAFMDFLIAVTGMSAIKDYANYMQPLGHAAITEKLSGAAAIKEMNRIATNLQTLALSTAQSSMELAQAYLFLETTPLKNQKGLIDKLMPIMAEAGTAYNVPVPDMRQAIYALGDVMKVPARDMLKAFGELAYAAKAAHFGLAAFGAGLPELGAAMRLYGATGLNAVTGLAAAMEAVVQFTKNPETATTGVSELLHYLSSPMGGRMFDRTSRSWKMLPAYDRGLLIKYGVPRLNLPEFVKHARAEGKDPLTALVDWLHGFFKHIAPQDVSDIAFTLGSLFHNKEAGEAIVGMLQNYDMFKDLQKELRGVSGKTVATDFATAMQFPEVQVKLFDEEFAQITRALGHGLLPLLRDLNVGLKGVVAGIKDANKAIPGLTDSLVQGGAIWLAVKGLGGVIGMLRGGIGALVPAFARATAGADAEAAAEVGAAAGLTRLSLASRFGLAGIALSYWGDSPGDKNSWWNDPHFIGHWLERQKGVLKPKSTGEPDTTRTNTEAVKANTKALDHLSNGLAAAIAARAEGHPALPGTSANGLSLGRK